MREHGVIRFEEDENKEKNKSEISRLNWNFGIKELKYSSFLREMQASKLLKRSKKNGQEFLKKKTNKK